MVGTYKVLEDKGWLERLNQKVVKRHSSWFLFLHGSSARGKVAFLLKAC